MDSISNQNFIANTLNMYGTCGEIWLQNLYKIISKIAEKHSLSNLTPLSDLSYNYLMSGIKDDKHIVIKLGLGIDGLKQEAAALKAFSRFGGTINVKLAEDGLLILEKVTPGNSLKEYFLERDNEAISIAVKVMKKLHKAPVSIIHRLKSGDSFPRIKEWLKPLNNNYDEIPPHYLEKARYARKHLLLDSMDKVLLHGDLHHGNILYNGSEWVAIDPKGVIGEQAYEVAAFIRNPIDEVLALNDPVRLTINRIIRFGDLLRLPRFRILDWCFIQALLAWIWAIEDKTDTSKFKRLSEIYYIFYEKILL